MDVSEDLLFVLRGWREGNTWRWSVVRSTDQQRLGFADLDSLYLFLAAQTAGTEKAPAKSIDQPDDQWLDRLVMSSDLVMAHNDSGYSHDSSIGYTNTDWMSKLDQNLRLSDLSLLGTHDTMAYQVPTGKKAPRCGVCQAACRVT